MPLGIAVRLVRVLSLALPVPGKRTVDVIARDHFAAQLVPDAVGLRRKKETAVGAEEVVVLEAAVTAVLVRRGLCGGARRAVALLCSRAGPQDISAFLGGGEAARLGHASRTSPQPGYSTHEAFFFFLREAISRRGRISRCAGEEAPAGAHAEGEVSFAARLKRGSQGHSAA